MPATHTVNKALALRPIQIQINCYETQLRASPGNSSRDIFAGRGPRLASAGIGSHQEVHCVPCELLVSNQDRYDRQPYKIEPQAQGD